MLNDELLPQYRLHELFLADVDDLVREFYLKMNDRLPVGDIINDTTATASHCSDSMQLIQDPFYRRFSAVVNWEVALGLFNRTRYSFL